MWFFPKEKNRSHADLEIKYDLENEGMRAYVTYQPKPSGIKIGE